MRLRADEIGCLGVLCAAAWFVATFFWLLLFWELHEGSSGFAKGVYLVLAVVPGALVGGIVAYAPGLRRYVNATATFAGVEAVSALCGYGMVLMLLAADLS